MKKIIYILTASLILLFNTSVYTNASTITILDIQYNTINLNSAVLISGTDKQQGAVYRYSNAIISDVQNVDAILILDEINGVTFQGAVDDSSSYYVWAKLGNSNSNNGYITYKFEFIKAGTAYDKNTPSNNQYVEIKNFSLTGMDLDGDGTSNEYFEINGYSQLIVNNPTNLTISDNSLLGLTRVTGSEVDTRGSTPIEKPENAFIAKYNIPVSSIKIIMGMTKSSSTRYFYINLGTEIPSGTNAGQTFTFDEEQVSESTVAPFIDTTITKDSNNKIALSSLSSVTISGTAYNLLDGVADPGSLSGQTVNLTITNGATTINSTATILSDDTYTTDVDLSAFTSGDITVDAVVTYNGNPATATDSASIIESFTITFDTDGGTLITPISGDFNDVVIAPENPTKEGYTFAGWDQVVPTTMPAEDVTITATWTINQYTITFDTNGGSAINPITQNFGTNISAPSNPTQEGCTFDGWYVDVLLTEIYSFATMPANDFTLYAAWTTNEYTITFDTDGGTTILPITAEFNLGIVSPIDPVKEGYTFNGWDQAIPTIMPAEDITITATWSINQYTISFNTNGGTPISSITLDFNTPVTAPEDPTKTGYSFERWNQVVPTTMPSSNITLVASWIVNDYTITFDTDGGSNVAAITLDYGTNITTPANPTKDGYVFNGWDQVIPATMPAENLTITATWTNAGYTITFDTDGGSLLSPIVQDANTTVTQPEDPTKEGYTFNGWDQAIPTTMPAGDITITATWVINQYTITFDTDGGTQILPLSQDFNSTVTVPVNPTKEGYTFNGWDQVVPTTMPAQDITITATWTPITYSITFDTDGGSLISAITQDYNTSLIAPEDPTKEGYTFDGWNISFPQTMPAGNITLTAIWSATNYTITFEEDGGSTVTDITQAFDTMVASPIDPTKEGYVFEGWYIDQTLQSLYTFATMPSNDFTLYAKWTIGLFTIEFIDFEGHSLSVSTYYFNDDLSDLVVPTTLPIDGYEFDGWSQPIPTTMPGENLVLQAIYNDIEAPVVEVDGVSNAETIYYQVNTPIELPESFVTDNKDSNLTVEVISDLDPTKIGTYRVIYRAIDHSGNVSEEFILTIIIEDTLAPEVVILVDHITIMHGENVIDAINEILQITDNFYDEFDIQSDEVLLFAPGDYSISIDVIDGSGNVATVSVNITVEPVWIYYILNGAFLVLGSILVVIMKKEKKTGK